jgi:hypothetical protein
VTTSRKKPGVAFWATVGLVVVLLYGASFGPVCWASREPWFPSWLIEPLSLIYSPVIWIGENGPQAIRDALHRYAFLSDD